MVLRGRLGKDVRGRCAAARGCDVCLRRWCPRRTREDDELGAGLAVGRRGPPRMSAGKAIDHGLETVDDAPQPPTPTTPTP